MFHRSRFIPPILYATYASFNSPGDAHVYRSTNAGTSWTGIDGGGNTGLPDIPVHSIAVDPANPSRLFIGSDAGVYTSTDSGASWNLEITGFAAAVTQTLSVNTVGGASKLFAFTHGRGVWNAQIAAVSGCTYTLSPNQTFQAAAGTGTVTVTAAAGCAWTAVSSASWLTVTTGAAGTSNGTVGFGVAANTGAARNATITVGGGGVSSVFSVAQAGASGGGNDEISGATAITALPYTTAQSTATATANPNDPVHSCTGLRDSNSIWFRYTAGFTGVALAATAGSNYDTVLAVYSGSTGAGTELACNDDTSGSLQSRATWNVTNGQSYLIEVNGYGSSSPGGSATLSVSQFSSCAVTVAPSSASFNSAGGSDSIAVTAPGCSWSAVSNSSWITIASGSSGTTSGTVQYSVAANSTGTTRSGSITIGSQAVTITQNARCVYSLSSSGRSMTSSAGSGSVSVATVGGCSWTVTNPVTWLTVTWAATVTGSGDVNFTVTANPAAAARTAVLTVAGQSYTVEGFFPAYNTLRAEKTLVPEK